MKITKIILLIMALFFTNLMFASLYTTHIKVYNNTDETLEITNAANISQTVVPNSSMDVAQYINKPASFADCQNFASTHTYKVKAKLQESDATFEQIYKIGCMMRIRHPGPGAPDIKVYYMGYLDPIYPPICKTHCDLFNTSYAMEHSGFSENPYYSALIFTIQK